MSQTINITGCFPSPLPARVKIDGYNVWGIIGPGVSYYTWYYINPGGSFTRVNVSSCLAGAAADVLTHFTIGDHTYSNDDFYFSSVDSKWKCGRPN